MKVTEKIRKLSLCDCENAVTSYIVKAQETDNPYRIEPLSIPLPGVY